MAGNTPIKVTPGQVAKVGAGLVAGGAAGYLVGAALAEFNNQLNAAKERQKSLTTSNTVSMMQGGESSYFTNIRIETYQRTKITEYPKLETKGAIRLPIPQSLNDSHSVNWNEEALNLAGGAAEAGSQALQGQFGNAGSTIASVAAGRGLGALGDVGGAAQALTGLAPNEFLTVLLKGPTYKKYTLSWLLSANTPEQSKTFQRFIKRINAAMAPEPQGGVFKYPNVFQVSLHKGTEENKYLYKFKPAVLDNFSVNYAAAGTAGFYSDGAPQSIIITMSFQEIEFWKPSDFIKDILPEE